ncbi:hypothetical protein BDC45DRAFT_574027 [Circinella umbellata]|nr:hypothetical protein BDC45DRAFT_574027 [Circinella umbellata]
MKPWKFIPSAWSTFTLPSNIQKRLYKFLLRKAIGQFLSNDLDLENFDIELVNGSVELRDLCLNLERLNEWIADTPFILEQGNVGSISASLPWSNFWNGDIALKVEGLNLTLRPTKRMKRSRTQEDEDSPIMSSSLHFADDFLRTEMEDQELMNSIQQSIHESVFTPNDEDGEEDVGTEGLQVLTRIIDKMLAKVKVDVINTTIRILHNPPSSMCQKHNSYNNEYFLDLHIPQISYFDETPEFNTRQQTATANQASMAESSVFLPPDANETIKIITISSPTVWLRSNGTSPLYNFHSKSETPLEPNDDDGSDLDQTEFYEANDGGSSFFNGNRSVHSSYMSGSTTPRAYPYQGIHGSTSINHTSANSSSKPYQALLFTMMDKENWIRIKLRPSYPPSLQQASDAPPIKQVDFLCTHICTFITPWQTAFLLDLFTKMNDVVREQPEEHPRPPPPEKPFDPLADMQQNQKLYLESDILPSFSRSSLPSSTFSSPPAATAPAAPELKVKFQINTIDCYFLYADVNEPTQSHECDFKDISHLKLSISQVVMRHRQFARENSSKRDVSLRHNTPPREGTSPISTANNLPLSILDVRISNVLLSEWIKRPPYAQFYEELPKRVRQIQYDRYNSIFEFDDSISNDYLHETEFPSISRHKKNTGRLRRTEVISLRVEKKQGHEVNRFVNSSTLDEETNIDIQPFILHIDAQIANRLENYVDAVIDVSSTWKVDKPDDTSYFNGSLDQRIYEDLDRASVEHQHRKKLRIRCAFIRILLYIPDMSQVCVRDAFNDLQHADMLSVDIKRLMVKWKSEMDDHENDPSSVHSRFHTTKIPGEPIKFHVDCNFINVFLHLAGDHAAHCWFTSKTVPLSRDTSDTPFTSSQTVQGPTFEITLQPSANSTGANPASAAKPSFFGAGSDIPNNIFEYLSKNESIPISQKHKVPMEDQAESSMIFKQRTIETSLAVVNCHFPVTRLNLTKEVWDIFQILQNDLILWQPKFMRRLFTTDNVDVDYEERGSMVSHLYGNSGQHVRDSHFPGSESVQASSVLSQSHERLGQSTDTPSLLSLVVTNGVAIWDLHHVAKEEPAKTTYQLHMSEFRYFTVVKHLGLNENITTLDIDDITLDRVTPAPLPVVCKTIPKHLNSKAKRNTSVVSLVAKLVTIPELNKLNKVTSVVACNLCWLFSMDFSVIQHLSSFQGIPEAMVFIDPATQYNKIYAHLFDLSVEYKPLNIPSRAAIVIDDVQVITDITSAEQPILDLKTYAQNVNVLLVDDGTHINTEYINQATAHLVKRPIDAQTYWTTIGYYRVLNVSKFGACVKLKLDDFVTMPNVDINILSNIIVLQGCSDTFHSLINFLTYVANQGDIPKPVFESEDETPAMNRASPIHVTQNPRKNIDNNDDGPVPRNMLESLDPEAFKRCSIPSSSQVKQRSGMDMNYVEEYYSSSEKAPRSIDHIPPQKPLRKHHAYMKRKKEDQVRLLAKDMEELTIVENFFSTSKRAKETIKPVVDVKRSLLSLRVRNFDVIWKLYEGHEFVYDYDQTSPPSSQTSIRNNSKENHLSRRTSIDTASDISINTLNDRDYISNSPTFSLSSERSSDLYLKQTTASSKANSKRCSKGNDRENQHRYRSTAGDIEIRLDGLSLDFNLMPTTDSTGLHLHLKIRDYQVIDNIKTSSWHQFLGYMRPDSHTLPRERGSAMLDFELTGVRPVPNDSTQEFRIKLKLLPMRLYVDQDALNFMVKFFTFDKSLLRSTKYANATIQQSNDREVSGQDIFFQHIEIHPIVLKIDYKPKYLNYENIKEGQLAELVNLFHLNGADIHLSHIKLTGINGFPRLADKLAQEWLPHIVNTQVPHMVSGVSPIRSIVNVSTGMADLILLPIQQYRKDGRIIRGIQKGTQAFARTTAMEAINLSARFASGAQVILEQADDFLASSSRHSREFIPLEYDADLVDQVEDDNDGFFFANAAVAAVAANEYHLYHHQKDTTTMSKFANQPSDLSQGLQFAYKNLSQNIGAAAQTIFAVPTEIIEQNNNNDMSNGSPGSNSSSPAKAVIRAVPVAVIKPMIGLTGAFQSIMVGLRNSIDPAMRLQSEDKYKR